MIEAGEPKRAKERNNKKESKLVRSKTNTKLPSAEIKGVEPTQAELRKNAKNPRCAIWKADVAKPVCVRLWRDAEEAKKALSGTKIGEPKQLKL